MLLLYITGSNAGVVVMVSVLFYVSFALVSGFVSPEGLLPSSAALSTRTPSITGDEGEDEDQPSPVSFDSEIETVADALMLDGPELSALSPHRSTSPLQGTVVRPLDFATAAPDPTRSTTCSTPAGLPLAAAAATAAAAAAGFSSVDKQLTAAATAAAPFAAAAVGVSHLHRRRFSGLELRLVFGRDKLEVEMHAPLSPYGFAAAANDDDHVADISGIRTAAASYSSLLQEEQQEDCFA